MTQPYQVVVLDWEGTLGDTLGQILVAIQTAASMLALPPFDETLARQSLNTGIRLLLKKHYPALSNDEYRRLLETVEHQLTMTRMQVHVFAGASEFLERLHQSEINLAIATNKNDQAIKKDLQMSGLHRYFKITRSANQAMPKPHPQMLEDILHFFHLPASRALMIGDSESDMMMAKAIGMDAVGMDPSDLEASSLLNAGALQVFQTFEQLAAWFFNDDKGGIS